MPDITMCNGDNCPFKETCYRYLATPSEYMQSYFMKPPFDMVDGEHVCSYYWEHNKKDGKLKRPKYTGS